MSLPSFRRFDWLSEKTNELLDSYEAKRIADCKLTEQLETVKNESKHLLYHHTGSGMSKLALEQEQKAIEFELPSSELNARLALKEAIASITDDSIVTNKAYKMAFEKSNQELKRRFLDLGFSAILFQMCIARECPRSPEMTKLSDLTNVVAQLRTIRIDNERHIKSLSLVCGVPYSLTGVEPPPADVEIIRDSVSAISESETQE